MKIQFSKWSPLFLYIKKKIFLFITKLLTIVRLLPTRSRRCSQLIRSGTSRGTSLAEVRLQWKVAKSDNQVSRRSLAVSVNRQWGCVRRTALEMLQPLCYYIMFNLEMSLFAQSFLLYLDCQCVLSTGVPSFYTWLKHSSQGFPFGARSETKVVSPLLDMQSRSAEKEHVMQGNCVLYLYQVKFTHHLAQTQHKF